jgi:hypothetical protein
MPLRDYRSLCPKSGHVLSEDERELAGRDECAAGRARDIRCGVCGRMVRAQPDPGTRQFLVYSMHARCDG